MRCNERARADEQEGDVDFLAGVDDRTRIGALRFRNPKEDAFPTTKGDPVPR
jgi:hypothetical protein